MNPLHRTTDLPTSVAAAIKAAKASILSVAAVKAVMRDGVGRIDEEIWHATRAAGYVSQLETIQHGRLALSESGILKNTGMTKPTQRGRCESTVWLWAGDEAANDQLDTLLLDRHWKRFIPPPGPTNAAVWLEALVALIVAAEEAGVDARGVYSLGEWLMGREGKGLPK